MTASVNHAERADMSTSQPWRLRRHAEYQRVYKSSRKQHSPSMTYFSSTRPDASAWPVARVGLTAGRVVGNAVVRNRIKRRMREAVKASLHLLPANIDVILHPRPVVLKTEFGVLKQEVEKIFTGLARRTPLSLR